MDLRLRIAEVGQDDLVHWLKVELLSTGGEVLDADRFRWAKHRNRNLLNMWTTLGPSGNITSGPPLDWVARWGPLKDANRFNYRKVANVAARRFLRRQELIQRGVAGPAWRATDWTVETGESDVVLDSLPNLAAVAPLMRGRVLLVDAPDVNGVLRPMTLPRGTVTTISTDFDGHVDDGNNTNDTGNFLRIGFEGGNDPHHCYTRFPLATVSATDTVDNVDWEVDVVTVNDTPTVDIQAYNQDGRADVEADSGSVRFTRTTDDASPYVNDSTRFQGTGIETIDLGTSADADVESAKDAVDRFTIAAATVSPSGSDEARLEAEDDSGTDEPLLIVTHSAAAVDIPNKIFQVERAIERSSLF